MGALSSSIALSSYAGVDGGWSLVLYYGDVVASWSHSWSLPSTAVSLSSVDQLPSLSWLQVPVISRTMSSLVPVSSTLTSVPVSRTATLPVPTSGVVFALTSMSAAGLSVCSMVSAALSTVHVSLHGMLRCVQAVGALSTVYGSTMHLESLGHRAATPSVSGGSAGSTPLQSSTPALVQHVRFHGVWLLSGASHSLLVDTLSSSDLGSRTLSHRKAVLSL